MPTLLSFPALSGRTPLITGLCATSLLATLLGTGACSERPGKKPPAKADTVAATQAPVKPVHCPLAVGPASERSMGGIEVGQPIEPLRIACRSAKTQSGTIAPSLKEAGQALWLIAGSDTVRVLADSAGRVVELDALTPGFVAPDSIRVGNTLQEVLRRRPNAAKTGAVQILQNQLTVGDGHRCGGVIAILSDNMNGQQIGLTPEEVSRLPGSLRVQRLAVVRCYEAPTAP